MKKNLKLPATGIRQWLFHNPAIHILLILIFTLIAYSNSFHVPFQFDDLREISGDHAIKNLKQFINLSTHGTRYMAYLSFAVNYALHGLDVVGYHIFNLVIHLTNALFVYRLIILSFKTPILKESSLKDSSKLIALFSALFFACHPVQTQAVTYIVQRLALLATFFYLFSIISYAKARLSLQDDQPKRKSLMWYGASLLSAVLAMKTKEISFTLPVVIALYEFMFFKAGIKKRTLCLLPMLLTMLIIPLSLVNISKPLGDVIGDVSNAARMQTDVSRWDYLLTQFRVITTYIRLIFLPINQNLNYDYPMSRSLFNPQVFLSFLFLLSILILGVYLFFRYRKSAPHATLISFGIFWFFITLSVESSVIPISDVIFEHRLYLPSIGLFIALVTSVISIENRMKVAMPSAGMAIMPILIVMVIVLSGVTIHRNTIWRDKMTLWSDVVKKSPNLAGPRNNLGNAFEEKGLTDKAIEQYQFVLARYPNNADAHHNLGIAFVSKGWTDKAIEQYQAALRLRPDYYDTYFNLGIAYFSQGLTDKAIEQYQKALKSKPDFAEAYVNLGIAYGTTGSIDKAVEYFETAIQLDPKFAAAYNNLGVAYEKLGSTDKAIEHLQTAIKLQPDYANAQYSLGKSYLAAGLTDKAIEHLQIAVRLQPGLAEAYKDFGVALRRKGLIDSAIEQFRTAINLKPDFAEAYRHLGDTFSEKRSFDLAIKQYQILIRLDPRSAVAYYNLGVNFYNKGLTEKAIEQFETALRLQSDFAEVHNALGTAYLKLGSIDKTIDHLQMAAKLSPNNPLFRNNLDKVYEMKNKADKSKINSNR